MRAAQARRHRAPSARGQAGRPTLLANGRRRRSLLGVRCTLFLCCAGLVWGQGTTPKSKADEYEVHAATRAVDIGAEFMVHSVLAEEQSTVVKDYLVVEVALFPPRGVAANSDHGNFTLRLNGKAVLQATPQMVALSMQHPDWNPRPRVEGGAGVGNTDVILGRPVPQDPPYGNGPVRRAPVPRPPSDEERAGIDPPERLTASQLVVRTALPEGEFEGPVSGYLYFPFRGKTASIKSLELLYEGTVLKLR
jgi:hypothetical protein